MGTLGGKSSPKWKIRIASFLPKIWHLPRVGRYALANPPDGFGGDRLGFPLLFLVSEEFV
jgi:hypothetical protein